ncbi:MAG TPA: RidA family protein [Dehalococcoidia bacterium]|nr:RidA family protein [Dehalococcoidia bacterium]
MKIEARLKELGLELPEASGSGRAGMNFVTWRRTGNLVYLAGHGPNRGSTPQWVGKVGAKEEGGTYSEEQGYQAARETAVNLLATLKLAIGDLDKVRQLIKMLGMVNCTPHFGRQPYVINGASDFFVEVFGEAGRHARAAVGMQSLPNEMPVEIELIVEVEPA